MKMNTRIITRGIGWSLIFQLAVLPVMAQRISYKEITDKRIEYIAPRLPLTAGEAEKLWPLFREFYDQREQISQKTRQKNKQMDNKPPVTEEEFLNAINDMIDSKIDQASLMKEYAKKYLQVIPPEKVFRLFQLDDEFNRVLLNQLKDAGPGRRPPEPEKERPPF
jgi:hypothetical protein